MSTKFDEYLDLASDEDLGILLTHLEEMVDFESYAVHNLKIQTQQSKIVPFALNSPQKILHKIIENYIAPKRLIRIVALKARRMGFSTYFSGRFYRGTSCNKNKYAVQVTHEPDATDFLFKMVKRFHNLAPEKTKPETLYNNTKLLEFNNKKSTGLNSAFRVATAGKDDLGSGQLIHYCHLSELAKYPKSQTEDLMTSITQCVPDEEGTEFVIESTAKGIGGEFYERFWNSRFRIWVKKLDENGEAVIEESINEDAPKEDIFTSIFLPWFCFDIYQIPTHEGFTKTEDEETLALRYGLSDKQIAWRRWAIANRCRNSIDVFNQEYPDSPRDAFLGSGRPVFENAGYLVRCMEACEDPKTRYELSSMNWVSSKLGRLRTWQEPQLGESYIISADVAEGIASGDFCSADVINHRTGDQVAQWHGHIDQDNIIEYAEILIALGRRYNHALLAIERNNMGLSVVQHVFHSNYKNIFAEMVPDPPSKPRKRYGWVTSRTSKPMLINNLINEVVEESHGIVCKETLEEMLAFKVQNNGKMEADSGQHDDRVMSIAIAKHVRQIVELPAARRGRRDKKTFRAKNRIKISSKGWT